MSFINLRLSFCFILCLILRSDAVVFLWSRCAYVYPHTGYVYCKRERGGEEWVGNLYSTVTFVVSFYILVYVVHLCVQRVVMFAQKMDFTVTVCCSVILYLRLYSAFVVSQSAYVYSKIANYTHRTFDAHNKYDRQCLRHLLRDFHSI